MSLLLPVQLTFFCYMPLLRRGRKNLGHLERVTPKDTYMPIKTKARMRNRIVFFLFFSSLYVGPITAWAEKISGPSPIKALYIPLSNHYAVLYGYLKEHDVELSLKPNTSADVSAIAAPQPKSPVFIRGKSNRAQAVAFEQSLTWADVVETGGFGYVPWYSKDLMPWSNGNVKYIALATDHAIANMLDSINEVVSYIHKADVDINAFADNSFGTQMGQTGGGQPRYA